MIPGYDPLAEATRIELDQSLEVLPRPCDMLGPATPFGGGDRIVEGALQARQMSAHDAPGSPSIETQSVTPVLRGLY